MMPRKKRITILIISVVVVVLMILITFLMLYLNTDMFKPKGALFAKYIGGNIDNTYNISKMFEKSEYDKLLDENKYTSNTQIKVNYTEGIGTSLENTQNDINKLKIVMSGEIDKKNNYAYQDIQLLNNEEKAFGIEYVQNENIYGIRFSDLFRQYISAENTNLKDLAKKIGYSEQELENIPNQIELNNELHSMITFTEEEKQNIKMKYSNLLINGIPKEKFSKKSNVVITIEDKNIKTNSYILTITKEQLNNIYINILEALKQDEIILSKLDNLQNILEQYKFLSTKEVKNIKEEFISGIDETIDEINKNNIGSDETKIIVYESNKETVRTTIQGVEYEINLDCLQSQEEMYIQLSKKDKNQESESSNILTLKNNSDGISFNISNTKGEEVKNINITQTQKIDNNNCMKYITAKFEDNSNKIEANIEQEFNIVNDFENQLGLNNENNIKLNNLNEEQTKSIVDTVSAGVTDKLNKLFENINREDILKVLEVTGIVKQEQKIEANGISETEKNRFNSQFEIFKGENLEGDSILNLIEASKNNLIGINVESNTELKLKLDRNNSDEKISETLTKFIENNKGKKYNVDFEYDQETGLINYIILNIVKEK